MFNKLGTKVSGILQNVLYKCKLSGLVTADPGTGRQTFIAYRRSDGELLGSTVWDDITHTYEIFLNEQLDQDIMLTRRDESGVYFAETYDKLSLCTLDSSHGEEFDDMEDSAAYIAMQATKSNLTSYPSSFSTENLKKVEGTFSFSTNFAEGTFKVSGNDYALPRKVRGCVYADNDVIVYDGNYLNARYGNPQPAMHINPLGDGSLLACYSLSSDGLDSTGNYNAVELDDTKFMYGGYKYQWDKVTPFTVPILITRAATRTVCFTVYVTSPASSNLALMEIPGLLKINMWNTSIELYNIAGTTWSSQASALNPLPSYPRIAKIAVVISSTGSDKLYSHGNLLITKTIGTPTILNSQFLSFTGANGTVPFEYGIKDVMVFNRELTSSEIGKVQGIEFPAQRSTNTDIVAVSKNESSISLSGNYFNDSLKAHFPLNGNIGNILGSSSGYSSISGVSLYKENIKFNGTSGYLYRDGYKSVYPFSFSLDTVVTTTVYSTLYGYLALNPTQSALGVQNSTVSAVWMSNSGAAHKFNIDYGTSIILKRIHLENFHYSGSTTIRGVKNFEVYGTNDNAAFLNITYATLTDLTLLGTFQAAQHVATDTYDPQFFYLDSNTTPFRYYVLRFADTWGDPSYMGIRFIELQQSSYDYDESNIDISLKFYPSAVTAQCLWKSGRSTEGIAIGIDSTAHVTLYARNSNVLTSVSFTAQIAIGAWYRFELKGVNITLYNANDEIIETKVHGLTLANYHGIESVGASFGGSPILGTLPTSGYFNGYISDLVIADSNTLEEKIVNTENAISVWSGENELPIERIKWDIENDDVILWTKIPEVSATEDTIIKIKSDIPSSKSGETGSAEAQKVWDKHFVGVYHMVPGTKLLDSTANHYDGELFNIDSSNFIVDVTGYSLDLNGTDEYAKIKYPLLSDSQRASVSVLLNADVIADNVRVLDLALTDSQDSSQQLVYEFDALNQLNTTFVDSQESIIGTVTTDPLLIETDYFVTTNYSGKDILGGMEVFVDGESQQSVTPSGERIAANTAELFIGKDSFSGTYFNGKVSELMISNKQRSTDFNKVVRLSTIDQLGTYSIITVGSPEPTVTSITAKSVIFDIADNWGGAVAMMIRSIDFLLNGVKLDVGGTVTATYYGSAPYSANYAIANAFIVSKSKTGDNIYNGYQTNTGNTNRRITIVFDIPQEFDEIVINNFHDSGTYTEYGFKNVIITASSDIITDPLFGNEISNPTVLFTGIIRQHVASNVEDPETVWEAPPEEEPVIESTVTAKSIIFDIANCWGSTILGIRTIEFYLEGAKLDIQTTSITCYASSTYTGYNPAIPFDVDTAKTGVHNSLNCWLSFNVATNVRLICVFNIPIIFDKVVVNNFHTNGLQTDIGIKDTVITISQDAVTNTTYGAEITTPTVLLGGQISQHTASNIEDPETLWEFGDLTAYKSIIFDIAENWGGVEQYMSIRSIEFYLNGTLIPVTSGFNAYATSYYSASYNPNLTFNTSLSKTGVWINNAWVSGAGQRTNQRLIVVFGVSIKFDTIVINNGFSLGTGDLYNYTGAKSVKITVSPYAVVDTAYNEVVPNSTVLFDGIIRKHVIADTLDDLPVWCSPTADSSVQLWLKGGLSSGNPTFTDLSLEPHTITPGGVVSYSNTVQLFNFNTIRFNGGYISISSGTDFNHGANPFTRWMWVYFNAVGSQQTLINSWEDYNSSDNWAFYLTNTSQVAFFPQGYQSGAGPNVIGSQTIIAGSWYHLEWSFDGSILKQFVNGVLDASWVGVPGSNSDQPITVGINSANFTTHVLNGYVAEIGILDKCLHEAAFTVPTSFYTPIQVVDIDENVQNFLEFKIPLGTITNVQKDVPVMLKLSNSSGISGLDVTSLFASIKTDYLKLTGTNAKSSEFGITRNGTSDFNLPTLSLNNGPKLQNSGSMKLDGSANGIIDITSNISRTLLIGSITCSFWVNIPPYLYTSNMPIFGNSTSEFYVHFVYTSNRLIIGHLNTYFTFTVGAILFNKWSHITAIRDNINKTFLLYIDGNFVQSSAFVTMPVVGALPLYIGGASSLKINGSISDIRIYNKAFSSAEVLNLYKDVQSIYKDNIVTSILKQDVPVLLGEDLSSMQVTDTAGVDVTRTYNNARPWEQQYTLNTAQSDHITGWQTESNSLPGTFASACSIVTKNRVYLVGGKTTSTGTGTTIVYTAPINPDGTIGIWTIDPNVLPSGVTKACVVTTYNRVYLLGGINSTGSALSTVYTAPINPDGTIGTWTLSSNALPDAIYYATVLMVNNTVYLIGGENSSYTTGKTTIYVSTVSSDGTLGTWSQYNLSLPLGSQASCLARVHNKVYLFGRYQTNSNSSYTQVYSASIDNTDGSLGAFTLDALVLPNNVGQGLMTAVVSKNRIFILGGTNFTSAYQKNIYSAPIDASGVLGVWSVSAEALPISGMSASVLVTSSKVYLMGGSYTPLSTVVSAPFLGGFNDYTDKSFLTTYSSATAKAAWYSLSNDLLTYKILDSTWKPIATSDPIVHGHVGDNTPYYWDADTEEWIYSNSSIEEAISNALEYDSNKMTKDALNVISDFSGVYSSTVGKIHIAVSQFSEGTENPEVTSIVINNKNCWLSDEYVLSDFCSTVTSASVKYAFALPNSTVNYLAATKLYSLITGETEWTECINETVPNLTVGFVTAGKSIRFKLEWDLSVWSNPNDVSIELRIA